MGMHALLVFLYHVTGSCKGPITLIQGFRLRLEAGRFVRSTVMIRPLVQTLMNRKVKADKDYNLSYITTFFKNQQQKNNMLW